MSHKKHHSVITANWVKVNKLLKDGYEIKDSFHLFSDKSGTWKYYYKLKKTKNSLTSELSNFVKICQ